MRAAAWILLTFFGVSTVKALITHNEFIDSALASNDIEQHVVAGLLAKSFELPYTNQQLYAKALELAPENILLLEQIIRYCDDDSLICQRHVEYMKKLEKTDPLNAVPNLYTMVYWGKVGQFKKALKQLEKAADKTVFADYNWPRFFLIDRVLQAYGYTNNQAKSAAANTIFMGNDNEPIAPLINLCKLQSENTQKWIKPCIELGKVMETYSHMVLSTFVGFAIQREMLALDQSREVEHKNVLHRRDVFHQFRVRAVKSVQYVEIHKDADFDQVPEIFFEDLEKYGERVAIQHALDRLAVDD